MISDEISVVAAVVAGIMLIFVAVHFLARYLANRWTDASSETLRTILGRIKSLSIPVHVGAWILGIICSVLVKAGMDKMFYGCLAALCVAFYSAIVALPVALAELFRAREKPLIIRLKFVGVAILAIIVLAGVVRLLVWLHSVSSQKEDIEGEVQPSGGKLSRECSPLAWKVGMTKTELIRNRSTRGSSSLYRSRPPSSVD